MCTGKDESEEVEEVIDAVIDADCVPFDYLV